LSAHLIVNRRARHLGESSPLLAELRSPRAGQKLAETSSLDELDRVARDVAIDVGGERNTTIVLAGGDGSYMEGVSALVRAFGDAPLPPIAFAPGGTVCTVARNWGVKGERTRYVRRLLDGLAAGHVRRQRRPTLRVRHEAGPAVAGAADRIGFIVGSGLVARFFEVYEEAGANGLATASKIVARVFSGSFIGSRFARSILDPTPCLLAVDGSPAPFDRVSLVCASVVRDLGLGMRLLYRAGEELDRFHVVATPLAAHALGPQMPLVLAGRPLVGARVDALARTLTLRFPDGRGAYVLDGDLYRADAIEVTAGPTLDVVTA
jgi:diacylglycerol kinase (ATP)